MRIDLNSESLEVGRVWNPAAAAEFNRRLDSREQCENLKRNLAFLIEACGYESPAAFAMAVGLHEITVERMLQGIAAYAQACYIAAKLGVGLSSMLEKDLREDKSIRKFLMRRVS